jgi:hypothetical protein
MEPSSPGSAALGVQIKADVRDESVDKHKSAVYSNAQMNVERACIQLQSTASARASCVASG